MNSALDNSALTLQAGQHGGAEVAGGWQPIETAPKDGTQIDLWVVYPDGEGCRVADCFWGLFPGYAFMWTKTGNATQPLNYGTITHWMPLPPAP